MKKESRILMLILVVIMLIIVGCNDRKPIEEKTADTKLAEKTERVMSESVRKIGMPSIVNFQEKRNLKWIYELCDKEDMITHAYLFNSMTGSIGQYLGECIGYGIPYSTQYSNPEKVAVYKEWHSQYEGRGGVFGKLPQAEPNGLFKPEGLSATWLIMIDPETKEPRPVYVEPEIIVSPFKLKSGGSK